VLKTIIGPKIDAVPSTPVPQDENKREIPIVKVTELSQKYGDEGLVKRALGLLSLWGECVYFESPPELSNIVILDPRFLAKGILADLFSSNQTVQSMKKNGVMRHADLQHIWKRFKKDGMSGEEFSSLCSTFLTLLQTLGVCFVMEEDRSKPFMEQRSIIPATLPERGPSDPLASIKFSLLWPSDPPPSKSVQIERVLKFGKYVPIELVSRLLVHLHPHIQDGLVWKNEVVILVKSFERSQAWIRVEEKENRFVVMLRGSEVGECTRLLNFIVSQVKEVSSDGKERGLHIEWTEKIRSPHYSGGFEIDFNEAKAEIGVADKERKLVCPETRLPIRAEMLLMRAGLSASPSLLSLSSILDDGPTPPAWWNFHSSSLQGDDVNGRKDTLLVSVFDKTSPVTGENPVKNQELYSKFERLFGEMNGDRGGIERVYGVNNPKLRSAFEFKREAIEKQHRYNPGLFRKEGWRALEDAKQRNRMYLHLSSKISEFRGEFNDGSNPFVVPMINGTSEDSAFRVMEGGFGTVAGLDDGYYGRGMYFTSDMKYADMFAELQAKKSNPNGRRGANVLLISAVLPGNPYPVTEHPFVFEKDGKAEKKPNPFGLLGQACKAGYQSHYTIVDSANPVFSFPTLHEDFDDPGKGRIVSDELVVFEGAQALPLFLVYYKAPSSRSSPIKIKKTLTDPELSQCKISVEFVACVPSSSPLLR